MSGGIEDPKAFVAKMADVVAQAKALTIKVAKSVKSTDGEEDEADEKLAPGITPIGPSKDKEELANKAREHNFPAPQAYDYEAYAARNPGPAPVDMSEGPAWASDAVKYEWKGDFGDIPPRDEALEAELFRNAWQMSQGEHMAQYKYEIKVDGYSEVAIHPILKFEDAGLHPIMLENVHLCSFVWPTPIQSYCLPAVLTGHDVIATAQTGSGKTAAYLLPILSRLMGKYKKLAAPRPGIGDCTDELVRAEPLVLIVAPTRELATQIFDMTRKLCYRTMLRPCVIYGGGPASIQRQELQKGCDVLIATPGRLMDMMNKPNILSMSRVKFTVLDEADELLQPDWEEDLQKIMCGGDTNEDADHIYMMFSATFNKESRRIARQYVSKTALRISVGRFGSTHGNIAQSIVYVEENLKREALYDILFSVPPARTLIFVNSKGKADLIDDYLFNKNLPTTSIHSDRTQREREDALIAFRTGKAPILVTTGVAARGLDVKNVMHVINFDLPSTTHGGIDEYVHRIGRTARIGNEGLATSFYNDRNDDLADDLVKLLIESKQPVPDFLADRAPEEGEKVEWNDETDSDDSSDSGEAAGGDNSDADGGVVVADLAAPDLKAAASEIKSENKWGGGGEDEVSW